MRKTKIICTLGPATSSEEKIKTLFYAGMDTARVNFSHGTYEEQQAKINSFKRARAATGVPAALLLDTKGPEIRLKEFKDGSVWLEEGKEFTLYCHDVDQGNATGAAVNYVKLHQKVKSGDVILIDDGKVELQVEKVLKGDIVCKIISGGKVSDRKSVNVPGIALDMEYLSEEDKGDIIFGLKNDIDYIAASFVRGKDDVLKLRDFLKDNDARGIKIISKIENEEGLNNFEEILKVSDGIMVARGDMGVELDFEKIPGIQKNIIKRCCETGKTVITATQMLESMIENSTPTRAEITDVANAVYDGTSAVMLSAETAVGKFPIETVKIMTRILEQAEEDLSDQNVREKNYSYEPRDVSDAVGHAACQAAGDLKVKAIIAVTQSGYTAEKISKYKPQMPILAATPNLKTYFQQSLTRGVCPVLTKCTDQWQPLMRESINQAKEAGFVEKGDQIVICAGMPLQETGKTNLMRIEDVV
ncbi:MAG: pyruvate kinase [Bacillota bacterium]|nr:pyruvate kinase [Bacillota bacterium]